MQHETPCLTLGHGKCVTCNDQRACQLHTKCATGMQLCNSTITPQQDSHRMQTVTYDICSMSSIFSQIVFSNSCDGVNPAHHPPTILMLPKQTMQVTRLATSQFYQHALSRNSKTWYAKPVIQRNPKHILETVTYVQPNKHINMEEVAHSAVDDNSGPGRTVGNIKQKSYKLKFLSHYHCNCLV